MSDHGDEFRAMCEASRAKRAANRESTAELLRRLKINFRIHNGGAHIVVTHGQKQVDIWPGTGKWIARNQSKTTGRGVFNMLKFLGVRS